jgi:hypothetical protein
MMYFRLKPRFIIYIFEEADLGSEPPVSTFVIPVCGSKPDANIKNRHRWQINIAPNNPVHHQGQRFSHTELKGIPDKRILIR